MKDKSQEQHSIAVRVPTSLYEAIRNLADEEDTTISRWIRVALSTTDKEKRNRMLDQLQTRMSATPVFPVNG